MTITQTENVHQTRWGYVATDYETYQKLRRLQYLVLLSSIAEAKHYRWDRKQPQNRFTHRWVRNEKGQKIKCIKDSRIPSPKHGYDTFWIQSKIQASSDPFSYFLRIYELIIEDYQRAKFPKSTIEEVKPIKLTKQQISDMLEDAEAWYADYKS